MKQENSEVKRLAWRPSEIAEMLGVSLAFIRKEIRAGNIKITKFGRAVSILDENYCAYVQDKIEQTNRNNKNG